MATFRRQFAACVAYEQNNKGELLFVCLFVLPGRPIAALSLCVPVQLLFGRAPEEELGGWCWEVTFSPQVPAVSSYYPGQQNSAPPSKHSPALLIPFSSCANVPHAFLLPGNLGSLSTPNQLGKGGWFVEEGEGGEKREDIWLHGNKPPLPLKKAGKAHFCEAGRGKMRKKGEEERKGKKEATSPYMFPAPKLLWFLPDLFFPAPRNVFYSNTELFFCWEAE